MISLDTQRLVGFRLATRSTGAPLGVVQAAKLSVKVGVKRGNKFDKRTSAR